ncbi:MAG: hypothetical protein ACRCW4_17590 [Candidatus Neomicrothrix subdominans]
MEPATPVQTRPGTDERLEALARITRTEVQHLTIPIPEVFGGGSVTTQMICGDLGDLRHWFATRGAHVDLLCLLDDKPIDWVDLVGIVAADRAGDPTDDLRFAQASDF